MNIEELKKRLESEKEELLNEIKKIAVKFKNDFEAKETVTNTDDVPDIVDQADEFENINNNEAILKELEDRLDRVDEALVRIQTGVYGKCVECGGEIEESRLLANAAAKTCKKHMRD